MNDLRERPTAAETEAWVAHVRPVVMSRVSGRRRWRRLARPTVALSVVGAVAVGGIAYAAVERTKTPEAPPAVRGNDVIAIGRPGPDDRWLNLSISYRCKPGQGFELRDDRHVLAGATCDQQMFPDEDDPTKLTEGPGGIQKSVPISKVFGTELTLKSTLTVDVVVSATYGPTTNGRSPVQLPKADSDGRLQWKLPTYRVNEFGLTVGKILADVPESAYPDLVPYELDGREVYVRSESFTRELPGRPEKIDRVEADLARGVRTDAQGRVLFKAYEADGKTFVGWVDSTVRRTACTAC
jgi:hypothetical protein